MSALCRTCGAYWDCEHARADFATGGDMGPPPPLWHEYIVPDGPRLGDTHEPDPETGMPRDRWTACDVAGVLKSGHGSAIFGQDVIFVPRPILQNEPASVIIVRILADFSTAAAVDLGRLSTRRDKIVDDPSAPLDAPEVGA